MRVLCGYRSRAFRAETEFFYLSRSVQNVFLRLYIFFSLQFSPVPSFRFPEVAPLPWPLYTSGVRSPVYSGVAAAAVHDDGYWPTRVPPCDVIRILYDVTDHTHASTPEFTTTTTRRTRIARAYPLPSTHNPDTAYTGCIRGTPKVCRPESRTPEQSRLATARCSTNI